MPLSSLADTAMQVRTSHYQEWDIESAKKSKKLENQLVGTYGCKV